MCERLNRFTRVMHAWKQYSLMHGEDRLLNLLLLTPNLWSVKSLTLFQLLAVWFICHILQNLGCTNDLFDAGFDVAIAKLSMRTDTVYIFDSVFKHFSTVRTKRAWLLVYYTNLYLMDYIYLPDLSVIMHIQLPIQTLIQVCRYVLHYTG